MAASALCITGFRMLGIIKTKRNEKCLSVGYYEEFSCLVDSFSLTTIDVLCLGVINHKFNEKINPLTAIFKEAILFVMKLTFLKKEKDLEQYRYCNRSL